MKKDIENSYIITTINNKTIYANKNKEEYYNIDFKYNFLENLQINGICDII